VLTDRRALHQILINLVNNAIKFTEEGSVRIRVEQSDGDRREPVVHVVDPGPGITVENQRRLFQAFEKLAVANGGNGYEGTGLGLHISERLAQLVDARLSFVSEPGPGSTFTVVVPAA
jgi:signal transduction histidine kinase